jgi:hypothetical protein
MYSYPQNFKEFAHQSYNRRLRYSLILFDPTLSPTGCSGVEKKELASSRSRTHKVHIRVQCSCIKKFWDIVIELQFGFDTLRSSGSVYVPPSLILKKFYVLPTPNGFLWSRNENRLFLHYCKRGGVFTARYACKQNTVILA